MQRRGCTQDSVTTNRMALYREADRLLIEQVAVLPLYYGRNYLLLKPWVKRYPSSPVQTGFWKDVVLEAHA